MLQKDKVKKYLSAKSGVISIVLVLLLALSSFNFFVVAGNITVTLHDGGKVTTFNTRVETVENILKEQKISLGQYDKVEPGLDMKLLEDTAITVSRAVPVSFNHFGEQKTVYTTAKTVAEFLTEQQVALGEKDYVTPGHEIAVEKDMAISAVKVNEEEISEPAPVAFETEKRANSDMAQGATKVVQEGVNGEKEVKTVVRYENGAETARTVVGEVVTKAPVNQIVEYGTRKAVVAGSSNIDLSGARVMNMQATAYYGGGITASGLPAAVGRVAVDPRVIPLGTRMYIETADGSLIYGYAVAADTGGAIKGNIVDLYFNTYQECVNFGRRAVKVYILD